MRKFIEYLQEAKKEGHGLYVFDIDDTLFHTTAKIKVKKGDKEVASLSNSEYNTHKLPAGHHYDYSEFRSADKFDTESKPIRKMLSKLKAIHKNVQASAGSKVVLNTARADFDNRETFLNAFRKQSVDIDDIHVHRAGNRSGSGTVAQNKADEIRGHLDSGKYEHATVYDDSRDNLRSFLNLKTDYPKIKFKAYHVKPDGSTARHTEED